MIEYAPIFPHTYEGLKLWDSNIVLARYVATHAHQLKNMTLLELSAGTGIASIAACKWAGVKRAIMTDTSDEVVANMKSNCARNKVENYVAIKMLWN
jgi:predicted nicotinamide N-methyase